MKTTAFVLIAMAVLLFLAAAVDRTQIRLFQLEKGPDQASLIATDTDSSAHWVEIGYGLSFDNDVLEVDTAAAGIGGSGGGSADGVASGLTLNGTTLELSRTEGLSTLTADLSGFLTGNETITLSGDATGSGTTAITVTLGSGVVGATELESRFVPDVTTETDNTWDLGSKQQRVVQIDMTSQGSITATLSNPVTSGVYTFHFQNAGTETITWPSTVKNPDGTQFTLTLDGDDFFTAYYDGTDYWIK